MKILVICQYYYPEQFRINDICEELVKKGNEVTVLTGLPNYPEGVVPKEYKFFRKRQENIKGVHVIRTWEVGRRKGSLYRIINYCSYMISASLKVLFMKKQYDCVYVYQLSPVTMAIPGIIYKKLSKKKMHLYCLDLWPASLTMGGVNENTKFYKIVKRVSSWIYNKADTIMITSEQFKKYLSKELEVRTKTIYMPQYAEEIYKKTKMKKNTKQTIDLLFAGNIGNTQSVETIIKAADRIKDKRIKIHIVGNGSSYEECVQLSKKLELGNIKFYGRKKIEEMNVFYQNADAMLITLKKDKNLSMTLPGKVQSYMAAGKPIIGAIDGATKEVIEKSKSGYCVNAQDYKRLAEIIEKFAKDSEKTKRKMGENAYKYYEANFGKKDFINNLTKILKKI